MALSEDCNQESSLDPSGIIRLEDANHVEKQFHQISLKSVEMAAAEAYVSKNILKLPTVNEIRSAVFTGASLKASGYCSNFEDVMIK